MMNVSRHVLAFHGDIKATCSELDLQRFSHRSSSFTKVEACYGYSIINGSSGKLVHIL
jgi:hypothetical protein